MNKATAVILSILTFSLLLSGTVSAAECPDFDPDLEKQFLQKSNYEVLVKSALSSDLQIKITEKSANNCLSLVELDSSVGAYGVLLHEKNTPNYHLFHAIKCSCDGAKPFRVIKMAEFSGDIPLISPRPQNYEYVHTHTGEEIDLGSAWKTIFVELLTSGEKYLYRRKGTESLKYEVN